MKRLSIPLMVCLILFLPLITSGEEQVLPNRQTSFFGVYGKKACVMGKVDGSQFETWIYPFKVFHDFRVHLEIGGLEVPLPARLVRSTLSPVVFRREYVGETWTIDEKAYPALDQSAVFLVFGVHLQREADMVFTFKPDLSPMWPASLGGKYSYWDAAGYFVLGEAGGKNCAVVGSGTGTQARQLPAHKLPGGRLEYRQRLRPGLTEIPIVAVAGHTTRDSLIRVFRDTHKAHADYLRRRQVEIPRTMANRFRIDTPDEEFNRALAWSVSNLHFAFVDNPYLGEGLVAGYGLSGDSERPGFAWYFGGDGVINSLAILDCGDFAGVQKEIEFLFKYQRLDGKIPHEISQGARFIDWFGDYGFPYFHGDTTLYFAVLLDAYRQRTGDTDLLRRHREKIGKIHAWMRACDRDDDGIVEIALAGAGASETGPLRQKMETDILLATLSAKAWESLANIFTDLGEKSLSRECERYRVRSRSTLHRRFWNDNKKYFDYALRRDGPPIDEITIWPAIGMRFNVFEKPQGTMAARVIASPLLSTDWGTRFLESESVHYNPLSYNNGAVWPFLTGFASLALYRYGNPYHGTALLMANAHIVSDFDVGAGTELLSGAIYIPLDQSVPNQIWSAGNTVSACVEGLLGFTGSVPEKTIFLHPALPFDWDRVRVQNLRLGKGVINLEYIRDSGRLTYRLLLKNLKGYRLHFAPVLPANGRRLWLDGREVAPGLPITIASDSEIKHFRYEISQYLCPGLPDPPSPGQSSRNVVIEKFSLTGEGFEFQLWGKGSQFILLFTDLDPEISGGCLKSGKNGRVLEVDFPASWTRKTVKGAFPVRKTQPDESTRR